MFCILITGDQQKLIPGKMIVTTKTVRSTGNLPDDSKVKLKKLYPSIHELT